MLEQNPERIYGWLNSQLSIARHYGGVTYKGHHYTIAYGEEGSPLVRDDVLKYEKKQRKKKINRNEKSALVAIQGILFDGQ